MKSWRDDPRAKDRFSPIAGFPPMARPAFDTFVKAQIAHGRTSSIRKGCSST
jgi:hypothetical protein